MSSKSDHDVFTNHIEVPEWEENLEKVISGFSLKSKIRNPRKSR